MLIRIILLGILIALGVMLYRKLVQGNTSPTTPETTAMRKCDQCGVHLPERDGVHTGEHFYCSEQHRLQHERNQRHD